MSKVLFLVAVLGLSISGVVSARTYVGSADTGIAKGWPQSNAFYPSNVSSQVALTLDSDRGTVEFSVGVGEGQTPTNFEGTYVRQGDRIFLYFNGRRYSGARTSDLFYNE